MNRWRPVIILAVAAALLALPVYSVLGGSNAPEAPTDYRVAEQAGSLGDAFTYQGRLTESDEPANGEYDLRFTIFGTDEGSGPVCTTPANDVDQHSDVEVSGGLFTVLLEFCPEAFDGDERWLEIAVRPGASTGVYTILSPRQPITPTPYALFAVQAGQAAALELPFAATGESSGDEALVQIVQDEDDDAGPALEVDGAIRVSGNQAAFTVVVDTDAETGNVCDPNGGTDVVAVEVPTGVANEASDLLFVTASGDLNFTPAFAVAFDIPSAVAESDCADDTWVIYLVGEAGALADGESFNVLVIKQEVD